MFVCDGGGMYDAEGRESFGSIRHGPYNGMCPRPSLLRARDISLAYLHIFMHLHTLHVPIHACTLPYVKICMHTYTCKNPCLELFIIRRYTHTYTPTREYLCLSIL